MARGFLFLIFFGVSVVHAFVEKSFYMGISYYSQNALGKTTASATSAPSFLGSPNYPVNLKYDWRLSLDWYLSPQLSYTPMARSASGDSAKVTLLYFVLPIGQNLGFGAGSHWDWSFGPGYIQSTIKGAGGTTVLSNGTGTSTFAVPGESVTLQTISLSGAGAYNFGKSRISVDLIFEGLLSSKRAASFMFSYAYRFGGGM